MALLLKRHFWLVHVLTIALCAIFLGRAAATLAFGALLAETPPGTLTSAPGAAAPPSPGRQRDGETILTRNIFCSTCAPIQATGAAKEAPAAAAPQLSALRLELVATLLEPDAPGAARAVLRDLSAPSRRTRIGGPGDLLRMEDGTTATVVQVSARRVYLRAAGRLEYLALGPEPIETPVPLPVPHPAPMAAPRAGGGHADLDREVAQGLRCTGSDCQIERGLVNKLLGNLGVLATQVHIMPEVRGGQATGFRVGAIQPGSIIARLGLQNGDPIQAVNDLSLSSPERVLEVYTKLRSASQLKFQLERQGAAVTLDYQIRG